MKFELSELQYDLNALEPYISKKTLEFHHRKHHQAYVSNLNSLIARTKFKDLDLETIVRVADGPVFNFAAQVWNHTFYFEGLLPGNKNTLKGPFADVIKNNFGSVSFFKNLFVRSGVSLFGAGWVWLVLNPDGSMEIVPKSNAGNPLRIGLFPLLTCDVWEHAYYLDYQNRTQDYLEAFWKLINWAMIEKRYNEFSEKRFNSIIE
jgi:Superoxide dismutase